MRLKAPLLFGLLGWASQAGGDPTWPSEIDELEEIMVQLFGFRARNFADIVHPCDSSGPDGRLKAAEWLRTAFHDMATGNTYFGTGGLDSSIQYELKNGENPGPGFASTLEFMAPYLTRRSSVADLIALGVYTSVLACGGPAIPFRPGRKDASRSGQTGVPQPQNSIGTFLNQFERIGFSNAEMIQLVACGHTLGAVHSEQFPDLVPKGSHENDRAPFDSSDVTFDNKVVTAYLDGSTQDPLVVGPAVGVQKNSDFKVFNSDNNITVMAMANPDTFKSTCRTVLQRMIDVVPSGVTLGTAVRPYSVKPVNLQLTLAAGGSSLLFTGYIRVRTTELPVDGISSIDINYKTRYGGTTCSPNECVITSTVQGVGRGFEDTFAFFPIEASVPVSIGISSFTVTVNLSNGQREIFDNNGHWYPIQDAVLLQTPQSCLLQSGGNLSITAAVRNDRAHLPTKILISYKYPRSSSPVPALQNVTIDMTKGACVGGYTLYKAYHDVPGGLSAESFIDIVSGIGAEAVIDGFKDVNEIGGTCRSFSKPAPCGGITGTPVVVPSTWSSSTATSTSSAGSSTSISRSEPAASWTTSSVSRTETKSTSSPVQTVVLEHKTTIGGYNLVSCWKEGTGGRALSGAAFAYDGMTLDSCMANCTGYVFWGTEYGRECYCGNNLSYSSSEAPLGDCKMACSGNPKQYCGAGNRLELYSTTASQTATMAPKPTGVLEHKEAIGKYALLGCWREGVGRRALGGQMTSSPTMTLEVCAAFCDRYAYFGTEYGSECYCGSSLDLSSVAATLSECSMTCSGNPFQYCGAGNRLELYFNSPTDSASSPTSDATSATSIVGAASSSDVASPKPLDSSPKTLGPASNSPPRPSHKPTVGNYSHLGCWTEGSSTRALKDSSFVSDELTLEACAAFCRDYHYFGTEFSAECYCGDFLDPSSSPAKLSDCSMSCVGDPHAYCGASNRLDLYALNSTAPAAAPSQPASVGDYEWLGCRLEPTTAAVRALGGPSMAGADMTNAVCGAFCAAFKYFGTEYGRECYCGNVLSVWAAETPPSSCGMLCAGSRSELCGAGNRLSVYVRPEPL